MYIYIYIHFEGDGKQIPDIKIPLHNRMENNVDGFSPLGLTLTPRRKEATAVFVNGSMGGVSQMATFKQGILYTLR